MKHVIAVLVLVWIFVIQVAGQNQQEKIAGELRQFETGWLTANLNADAGWVSRFSAQKLNVLPPPNATERAEALEKLTATTLRPDEMKVRISGTISLLTNDPGQNRSYYFLDTFNRIGGKWQVIASSISPTPAAAAGGREQIEQEVLRLENEWARAVATNDRLSLSRILSPDIVATLADGKVRNFQELADAVGSEHVTRTAKSEMQVHGANESLAIVTGIDTTFGLDKGGKETAHVDRFTDTWSKNSNGQWQCVASHVTRSR